VQYGSLIALNGALLRLLRAKAQAAQNPPHLYVAVPHAVHALDDRAHTLESPQVGAKAVLDWALQDSRPHLRQLCVIEMRRPTSLGHCAQGVNAPFIEQPLPRVHGLPGHPNHNRSFCRRLSRQQHSPSSQPLLCSFAQPFLHHDRILQ